MRQFYGAWKNAFSLQEKTHVHNISRFRAGGSWVLGFGGGSADFIFMGAWIFLMRGSRGEIQRKLGQVPVDFLLISFQFGYLPLISTGALQWQELGAWVV